MKSTIDYYDREAVRWEIEHDNLDHTKLWQEELKTFNSLVPKGKILEIGPGAGHEAKSLIALGYKYVGIDVSRNLLQIAQKRNPEGSFKLMDLLDLSFKTSSFDCFWCVFTLLHITKINMSKALVEINNVIKPKGIGFIAMKAGSDEHLETETGRWFNFYSLKGFRQVLEENGFEVIEAKTDKNAKGWWLGYFVRNIKKG